MILESEETEEVQQEDEEETEEPQETEEKLLEAAEWQEEMLQDCPFPEIFGAGTPMDPFHNTYLRVVRIVPEQIGMLPEQYWGLANNSFVLHGFYGYRHLLLCLDRDGRVWFGVPGIFHPRESRMARMTGFPRFQPIDQGRNGFGYWMKPL